MIVLEMPSQSLQWQSGFLGKNLVQRQVRFWQDFGRIFLILQGHISFVALESDFLVSTLAKFSYL